MAENDPRNLQDQFVKNGFIHIKNAISPERVQELREKLDVLFGEGNLNYNVRTMRPNHTFPHPDLYLVPFLDKIVGSLKSILGDPYTMFADYNIQRNGFGNGYKGSGWHPDANTESGKPYLKDPDYRFVKCGLYLQDNTREWGGGVDIIPGSHLPPKIFSNPDRNDFIQNKLTSLKMKFFPTRAPLKAGDFLAFDSRMWHRSSWPHAMKDPQVEFGGCIQNIPHEHTKYVIYWNSCANNCVDDFLEHSMQRAEGEEKANCYSPFFGDYLKRVWPQDYPQDFVDAARNAKINIASLDEEKAQKYKEKHPDTPWNYQPEEINRQGAY